MWSAAAPLRDQESGCLRIPATAARVTASVTGCYRRRARSAVQRRRSFFAHRRGGKTICGHCRGADIAIGSRWLKTELQLRRQPLYRQLLGRVFNLALRLILGLQFEDTQCGFKAFQPARGAALFPLQKIERWGFDPELLYLAKRLHLESWKCLWLGPIVRARALTRCAMECRCSPRCYRFAGMACGGSIAPRRRCRGLSSRTLGVSKRPGSDSDSAAEDYRHPFRAVVTQPEKFRFPGFHGIPAKQLALMQPKETF